MGNYHLFTSAGKTRRYVWRYISIYFDTAQAILHPKHGQRLRSRFGPYSTTERIASAMNKFAFQKLFGPRIHRWNPAPAEVCSLCHYLQGLYIPIVAGFLPSNSRRKKTPNSSQPITPQNLCRFFPRWWFQIFFIFIPSWGRFPCWLIFFKWVGSTTNQLLYILL